MVDDNTVGIQTGGAAPLHKKKSSIFLRDVYKLYRSISKLWSRDNHRISSHDAGKKMKCQSKLNAKSESKSDATNNQGAHISQDPGDDGREEGVKLCRVRSYRYENNDFLRNKPSLSRNWSQNAAVLKRPLSSLNRSKSSNRVDCNGFPSSTLRRTTSSVQRSTTTPILFSSSNQSLIKPPPTEERLECTLEELCKGCTKMIKIKRDVITITGQTTQEEEMVKIKVKPGWKNGTKVTFEGKGNEAPGSLPADLTFVIAEKEHELFRRERDDLEMEVEIPLLEALTGCNLSITLPDGEKMSLKIDDVIHNEYVKIIKGKGIPNLKEQGKRGDLRITFQVKFPAELTGDQRADIRSVLADST